MLLPRYMFFPIRVAIIRVLKVDMSLTFLHKCRCLGLIIHRRKGWLYRHHVNCLIFIPLLQVINCYITLSLLIVFKLNYLSLPYYIKLLYNRNPSVKKSLRHFLALIPQHIYTYIKDLSLKRYNISPKLTFFSN